MHISAFFGIISKDRHIRQLLATAPESDSLWLLETGTHTSYQVDQVPFPILISTYSFHFSVGAWVLWVGPAFVALY